MSRYTTTDVRSFTIFFLNKYKKLEAECRSYNNNIIWSRNGVETGRIGYSISTITGDSFMNLSYKIKGCDEEEWRSIEYKVALETVPCHFGAKRWYFRCSLSKNGQYCGRRVAILYQAGDYFGCRHCADLTYESCNEPKRFRGWPWKILSDSWKGDELYGELRQTHYRGRPTRKYKRCLRLWGSESCVQEADKQLNKQL